MMKSIILKCKFTFNHDIKNLDSDYNNEYLVILFENDLNKLCYFRISDLSELQNGKNIIEEPYFSLKFQDPVIDFFINKNSFSRTSGYLNFLIVQTNSSLIIYRESKQRIMKKVFSFNIRTNNAKETKFSFIKNDADIEDKGISCLIGCFYIFVNNTCHICYVKNLEKRQQAILTNHYRAFLPFDKESYLISVNNRDLNNFSICTFTKDFVISKYSVHLINSKVNVTLNCFRLLNKSIKCSKFVYNNKNKFIFGNLEDSERLTQMMQGKYEEKFFYKVIFNKEENFKNCFWSLINESVFVKINVQEKYMGLYEVNERSKRVALRQKSSLSILQDKDDISLIRFLLVSSNEFVVMLDTLKEYTLIRCSLENKKISAVDLICGISKENISESEINQYELVLIDHTQQIYKFTIINKDNEIKSYQISKGQIDVRNHCTYSFDCKILEFYKNDIFPFNVIVLTNKNELFFFSHNLEYQCDYNLANINLNLKDNSNNFHLKKLYENYYIVR